MANQVDLSKAPYNGRYNPADDYYHIAAKPAVSFQAREVNDLQSMFKAQIERFGDNIFTPGTIVSGCNFLFLDPYQYIKIEDQDIMGVPVSPAALVNVHITCDATGLRGHIIDYADGYLSAAPDAKTLYVSYLNTGYDANTPVFSPGDVLRVYDGIRNGVETVSVTTGGSGFANGSKVVAVSALAITTAIGTFANGDYITNGLGANVQIIAIDNVSLAAQNRTVLKVKPRPIDLANVAANSTAWTIANGQSFHNLSNTATGSVAAVIGVGYAGQVVTDGIGTVTQVITTNKGVGYTQNPTMAVLSANNSGGYDSLLLASQTFLAKIKVANIPQAVGNGYAFGVNDGHVYLDGRFLRVAPQTIIVSKYDQKPDGVAVGFTATETIVNANIDPGLNDPAAGDNNDAPGADRIKIVPQLTLMPWQEAEQNSAITPLVEWNNGSPYIQKQQTDYNKIGDAMAQRTADTAGDFFIDPFLVTTRSSISDPVGSFDVVVDSGSAYINGYKVETSANYFKTVPFETSYIAQAYEMSLNYGNYIQVRDVSGTFQFNTGDTLYLYDTAKGFLSNTSLIKTQNTAPVGNQIGTACIRSMSLASGSPGTNTAIYNLYLFDVTMTQGNKFTGARSIYSNGTNKGIADLVTALSPTTLQPEAQITFSNSSSLVFQTPLLTVKSCSNTSYIYRSLDQTVQIANSGILTKSIAANTTEYFPYSGVLSPQQMTELYLVPQQKDFLSSVNATGTWSINTTSANAIGTGTTALADLAVGDYIYSYVNSTSYDLRQVLQIVNNTLIVLDSNSTVANTTGVFARCYPKNVPIPAGTRSGISANVSSNGNILNVNLGFPLVTSNNENVSLGVNILRIGVGPTPKTVNRKAFIKINLANNAQGSAGPWCLGVPDAFRLRSVFTGNSSVTNTGVNYVKSFSLDTNQTSNFYDLSWLYLNPGVSNPGSDHLLVEFDYFTSSGSGYYVVPSYTQTSNAAQMLVTDSTPLANLTTMAATHEIPQFFTDDGIEVDLLACIDFRPYVQSTATPGASPGAAPINPVETRAFAATEKKFPVPGTLMNSTVEYFVPRIDQVAIGQDGNIIYTKGQPLGAAGYGPPLIPGTLKIGEVCQPRYPNLPENKSSALLEVMDTNVVNTRVHQVRILQHLIVVYAGMLKNVAKRYTNSDVARLEQRLSQVENVVALNTLENATNL